MIKLLNIITKIYEIISYAFEKEKKRVEYVSDGTVSMSYFSYFVTHILHIAIRTYIYFFFFFFTDMNYTSCALSTWKTGLSLKLYI